MSGVEYRIKELKKNDIGCKYNIEIKIPTNGWIDDVHFVVENKNYYSSVPLKFVRCENGRAIFTGNVDLETSALYRYCFFYRADGKPKHYKREDITHEEHRIIPDEMWKMSVNFKTPDWAKGKIMYHIFVDRFKRGSQTKLEEMPRRHIHTSWDEDVVIGPDEDKIWNNDFFGGDIQGIIEKLDYLKELGVAILYLSPIMMSQSNHRYDTADYECVDPYAGTNLDLKKLCDEAHQRNMKVILDGVFNHTGNDSKYFNQYKTYDTEGAYQNPNSPYAPFYHYRIRDNQIYYQYWFGFETLPRCNCYSKEWQEYITGVGGVIDKWFNLGIDGLRLDVADELSDTYLELIRRAVKRNKEDGLIIGEVWEDPMNMNRGYIENGKCMDTVMNYQLADALIRYFKYNDINKLAGVIRNINVNYPDETIYTLMNFTSTHDISRPLNIFGTDYFAPYQKWAWDPTIKDLDFCRNFKLTTEQYVHGKEVYKAFVFALAFMPGIFSIFYGDEVGIEGHDNLANRKQYPWGSEDKDLLEFFKSITTLRNKQPFLETANLKILHLNYQYFMFERKNRKQKSLFVVNRTDKEVKIALPSEYQEKEKVYSLNNSTKDKLTPYGAIIVK